MWNDILLWALVAYWTRIQIHLYERAEHVFSVNSNSYAMETERHLLNDLGGSGLLEHVKVSVFFLCWVLVSTPLVTNRFQSVYRAKLVWSCLIESRSKGDLEKQHATPLNSGRFPPAEDTEVIFPFQFASFLMTLVRKGIITTKGFHAGNLAKDFIGWVSFA